MGTRICERIINYNGKVCDAKDNVIIESKAGKNSINLASPIDFVDGVLRSFVDKEVRVTITVTVEEL